MPSTFRAAGINTATVYKEQRIPECAPSAAPVGGNSPSGARDIGVRGNGEIRGARIPPGSTGSHPNTVRPALGQGPQGSDVRSADLTGTSARLTRLRREDMAVRSIPDAMKAQLAETGIPVAPRRIEHVTTPREADPSLLASGGPLHRLTEQADSDAPAERSSFGVEPGAGPAAPSPCPTEKRASPTRGPARGWTPITTLHRYGAQVTNLAPLGEPDG